VGWHRYLNRSNRPVRTRMPGGVAGERPSGRPLCRFSYLEHDMASSSVVMP